MLRIFRLAALGLASLMVCALPAAAQTISGVPTLGSDSSTYTWGAQTVATGKLGGVTVKYTYNGTAWGVEPADSAGRPQITINAPAGAYAAGSFLVGAAVDGWDATQGSKADSPCVSSVTACSINARLAHIEAAMVSAVPVGSNVIGGVTQSGGPWTVTPQASSTGGRSLAFQAALSTTVQSIKSSAGTLYKIHCYNPNSSAVYIQVFNLASGSVTLGTTGPTQSYGIAATSSGGYDAASLGDAYGTAISWAATTTANGSTAPSTGVTCNASYN